MTSSSCTWSCILWVCLCRCFCIRVTLNKADCSPVWWTSWTFVSSGESFLPSNCSWNNSCPGSPECCLTRQISGLIHHGISLSLRINFLLSLWRNHRLCLSKDTTCLSLADTTRSWHWGERGRGSRENLRNSKGKQGRDVNVLRAERQPNSQKSLSSPHLQAT